MLKMVPFSPAQPRRLLHPPALSLPIQPLCPGTRRSAGFVLGSTKSSTYPTWERAALTAQGRVGGKQAPPVFASSPALLDDHFEHPRCLHEPSESDSKKRSASIAAIHPEPAAVTA